MPGICSNSASCTVVALELHPNERQVDGTQESVVADACVVLHYMPECIYVRVRDYDGSVLPVGESFDVKGVVAIKPASRQWTFTPSTFKHSVDVSQTQMPLLPRRQCTLHGVQGKHLQLFLPSALGSLRWELVHCDGSYNFAGNNRKAADGAPDANAVTAAPAEEVREQVAEIFIESHEECPHTCSYCLLWGFY